MFSFVVGTFSLSRMISMIGRPANAGWYLEPWISPVTMKNVPGKRRSFRSGTAIRNWLIDESSKVIETQASFPSCYVAISEPGVCAQSGSARKNAGMTLLANCFMTR